MCTAAQSSPTAHSPVSQKEHRPRPFGKSQALPCRLCRGFEVTVSRPSSTRAREKPPAFERWREDIWGPWVARTHHQQADCAEKVPSKTRRPVLCLPPHANGPNRLCWPPGDPPAHQEKHHLSLSRCACRGKSHPPSAASSAAPHTSECSELKRRDGCQCSRARRGSISKLCSCCYILSPLAVREMPCHVFPVISLQVSKDQQEMSLPVEGDSAEGKGPASGKTSHSVGVDIHPSFIP